MVGAGGVGIGVFAGGVGFFSTENGVTDALRRGGNKEGLWGLAGTRGVIDGCVTAIGSCCAKAASCLSMESMEELICSSSLLA